MTRKNPPAKWVLPEAVDPPATKCFVIQVPDDPQHIAAFRGALLNLASAYKWADDATHMARDVALRWRQAIEDMTECDMAIMLRTNPFDSCGAQVSYDGGVIWTEFFNARACAKDTIEDMDITQEVPGGANPEPSQCFDLDLVVSANAMKLIPLPIQAGWTLQFTAAVGAWNDGNAGHDWVCPTGHAFFLGTCSPLLESTQAGDPINTLPHMQLIARLPDGTYDEIPLDGSDYVVPAGQPLGNFFLLANDDTLAGNAGSVSLHVLACNTNYDVTWTVQQGTGPNGAKYGSEVVFTSTDATVAQFYFNTFSSTCVRFTVLEIINYTQLQAYGYVYDGTDCDDNFYYNDNWTTDDPLDWVSTRCVKGAQFQGGPSQFQIKIRIDADCP